MKVMMLGFVAVLVIAAGADIALDQIGYSAQDRMSGAATRVSTN